MKNKKIKEVSYYWYDHCFIRDIPALMTIIETAIANHDYKTFKALQYILNRIETIEGCNEFPELNGTPKIYLPDEVFVEYEDDTIEELKLTKQLFNKITFSEYEAG